MTVTSDGVKPEDLPGTWHLEAYVNVDEQGGQSQGPLGGSPRGVLLYGADGSVSVSMMRSDPAPDGGPTFLGYAGRWRLDGPRTVVHAVEIASRPDMVGTEQVRSALHRGETLVLEAAVETQAGPLTRRLTWNRAGPR